ncbi:hypothetical protein AVEN_152543-1, partial [Araneus ventricosus]
MFTVLNCQALSPDFHPVGNVWGILIRSVYENVKRYSSVEELKSTIDE